ncbi:MAG: NYN domain-containing protein [Verrucomicrobia bacterium]|nr:MAG: NYN domain-containing protein [Verrucomicrobiota bacterium]
MNGVLTARNPDLLRVGIYYDGNFFSHVSLYYRYGHPRRQRLSIRGLHEFIRHRVAEAMGVSRGEVAVTGSHYFRARYWARQAQERDLLFVERAFEDVLISEGVTPHYLPNVDKEKGIEVWLALEAYEAAAQGMCDLVALVAGDSDFVPLARKLNALGVPVMVLGWDVRWEDDFGNHRETVSSIQLMEAANFPLWMNRIVDEADPADPIIGGLFMDGGRSGNNTDATSRENGGRDNGGRENGGGENGDLG